MKKFFRQNPLVTIILVILATVLVCAVVAGASDSEFKLFERERNKENLLLDTYEDFDKKTVGPLKFSIEDGVVTMNGKIADSDDAEEVEYSLLKITLKAGTYTYTCFDDGLFNKPATDKYYSMIRYTDSEGAVHVVLADFGDIETEIDGIKVESSNTFALAEDTEVEIFICVTRGTNLVNVKAYPVLVNGDEPVEFYGN